MPSPFPGMDPYIERPELWSDFHSNLAAEIRGQLNQHLLPRYFARLTSYATHEIIEVAAVGALKTTPIPSLVPYEFPLELLSVEIRMVDTQLLVTTIEILSPVNKRRDHEAQIDYHRKRRDMLRSGVHFMEIDLLRGGVRFPLERPVPSTPYYVFLSRANRRPAIEVWPLALSDKLPILPIPLLEPDPDVPLDLGAAVASVYERGAYAPQIDYRLVPPPPALTEEESNWVDSFLREKKLR